MSAVRSTVALPAERPRVMPTVDAEARSRASRAGWTARRMKMAIAGDRDAGIHVVLDRLGVTGPLRQRCEFFFAAGAHLNPLEDAAAVMHAAQLSLLADAHHAAIDASAAVGEPISEWRSKHASYSAVAAGRALVALRLSPSTRKPVSSSREGKARAAAAATADLSRYRA